MFLNLQKEQKVGDVELRHRVFIYGTLKHGQPNHHLMNMHELGRCQLIGCARTDVSFPLIITTRWNLPFLLYAPGHGQVAILRFISGSIWISRVGCWNPVQAACAVKH